MPSREYYEREYEQNKRSPNDIARELQTYPKYVRRELEQYGFHLRSRSEAQAAALSSGRKDHPTQGKKRSEEVRSRISKSVGNSWKNLSEDERSDRVEIAKQKWLEMSEEEKKSFRGAATDAIREAKNGSKLEKFLLEELRKLGFHLLFHQELEFDQEKILVDMFLPKLSIVIEVNGPSHSLPIWGEETLEKTREMDTKKTLLLLTGGFVLIRVNCVAKSISKFNREKLLNLLVEEIDKIRVRFPDFSNRLIEIEVNK